MVCMISLFLFTSASISSFVFYSVQLVFVILLQNHISEASSLSLSCFSRVYALNSLVKTIHINVFNNLFVMAIDKFWFTNWFCFLWKASLASAILFFKSLIFLLLFIILLSLFQLIIISNTPVLPNFNLPKNLTLIW